MTEPAAAHILYLHGLASSPLSTKARFFTEKLGALGHEAVVPDLNQGDFTGLTTTRALKLATAHLRRLPDPVVIFGSSFGGRVAALCGAAHPSRVAGLVLMAPAFSFENVWRNTMRPEDVHRWRETGLLPVEHPAYEGPVPLGYGFFEDALQTDAIPRLRDDLPALVFHGIGDDVVPIEDARRFAQQNPAVRLVELDSDHELTDQTERMWQETEPLIQSILAK